jgi:hypothetical protein
MDTLSRLAPRQISAMLLTAVVLSATGLQSVQAEGEHNRFTLAPEFGYRRNDSQIDDLRVGVDSRTPQSTGIDVTGVSSRHTTLDLKGSYRPWKFLSLYGILGYDDRRDEGTVTTPGQSFTIPVIIDIPELDIPDLDLPPIAVPLVYYPEVDDLIALLAELPSQLVLAIPVDIPSTTFDAGSSMYGPTIGAGLTLHGDIGLFFAELDGSYRYTDYRSDFGWIEGSAELWQGFARAGIQVELSEQVGLRLWGGAYYLDSTTDINGEIPLKELDPDAALLLGDAIVFETTSEVKDAWSGVVGVELALGSHWQMQLEGGAGDTSYISFGGGASF